MEFYRPLLIQKIQLRLPGLRFRGLRLNRHLARADSPRPHTHQFSQILCYLGGRGTLEAAGHAYHIGPGSIVWLPPGIRHGFHEVAGRRPLCLVLEFDWSGAAVPEVRVARLPLGHAAEIRRRLAGLAGTSEQRPSAFSSAALVLQIFDVLLGDLQIVPAPARRPHPLVVKLERFLRRPGAHELGVAAIAAELGYSADYLSRSIRRATGRTLREFRDQVRLDHARRLLVRGMPVQDAAAAAGIFDRNYFARWFKKHTGLRPSQIGFERRLCLHVQPD